MKALLLSLSVFCLYACNVKQLDKSSDKANLSDVKRLAQTPPMGWNSYNCFGATVTESEVRANADYMAKYLKKFGWEYIVVDYCWFYPHPPGSVQCNPPQFRLKKDGAPVPWFAMDEYGRLLPDIRKFPSSVNGLGFKPLADYIHSLGLKFGLHIMRGIPRQAVWANSPIKDASGVSASMIADTSSVCPWLNSMYGVNMNQPGSQAYYNSLVELYKEWGVDFIKIDDVDLNDNYPYYAAEAEAIQKAIQYHSADIVLSLSLNLKLENKSHVKSVSNMWRISKDFWDNWGQLKMQFELCNKWSGAREPGNWPDADMLQLGRVSRRGPRGPERDSRFTEDEEQLHMTLWCISQSPLMMGGDMPLNSDYINALLTNEEVLAVNQNSKNSRQVFRENGSVIWMSEDIESDAFYLAVFNLNDTKKSITIDLSSLGLTGTYRLRDLWKKKDAGEYREKFVSDVFAHGSKLFKLIKRTQ